MKIDYAIFLHKIGWSIHTSIHTCFVKVLKNLHQLNVECRDFQILEETDILFPDDELDILDLDEDELLFEVGILPSYMLNIC